MSRRTKINANQKNFHKKSRYYSDLKKLACDNLLLFFENKISDSGEKISKEELLYEENINILLNTCFDSKTFDFIHDYCLISISKPCNYKEKIPWTVNFLIKLLEEMIFFKVPKELHSGLILLYFKFCKGIKIPNYLIN
jgi:hypothetical protein